MELQLRYFKSSEMMLWNAAFSTPANLENSAVATGLEKVSFHCIPKKGNAKDCLNYLTIAVIPGASKMMLKILQTTLQQYMNWELPNVQAGLRKDRGTGNQITNWIIEKAREFQKNIYFCFIDYAKAFDCMEHNKQWKILRDGKTRPPYLPPQKSVCRSRSNGQNRTWNKSLVPNWERSTSRLYTVTLLIQLMCRVHHVKCWAGWSTIWNQDFWEKYQ